MGRPKFMTRYNNFITPLILHSLGRDWFDDLCLEIFPDNKIEFKEEDGNYFLKTVVPGFEQDELMVEIKDGSLSISGNKAETSNKDNLFSSSNSEFCNSYLLPSDVDIDKISAEHKAGILVVTMPKVKGEVEKKKIEIKG